MKTGLNFFCHTAMGGFSSRFHDPDDAYVVDMVFNEFGPMFHGPIEFDRSACPYCRTYFYAYGLVPDWTCFYHVSPRVHGGA